MNRPDPKVKVAELLAQAEVELRRLRDIRVGRADAEAKLTALRNQEDAALAAYKRARQEWAEAAVDVIPLLEGTGGTPQ